MTSRQGAIVRRPNDGPEPLRHPVNDNRAHHAWPAMDDAANNSLMVSDSAADQIVANLDAAAFLHRFVEDLDRSRAPSGSAWRMADEADGDEPESAFGGEDRRLDKRPRARDLIAAYASPRILSKSDVTETTAVINGRAFKVVRLRRLGRLVLKPANSNDADSARIIDSVDAEDGGFLPLEERFRHRSAPENRNPLAWAEWITPRNDAPAWDSRFRADPVVAMTEASDRIRLIRECLGERLFAALDMAANGFTMTEIGNRFGFRHAPASQVGRELVRQAVTRGIDAYVVADAVDDDRLEDIPDHIVLPARLMRKLKRAA